MQTVRLGRVLLVAAVSALIPLAGNVVASVLTDWTGRAGWLVVPTVGVVAAGTLIAAPTIGRSLASNSQRAQSIIESSATV